MTTSEYNDMLSDLGNFTFEQRSKRYDDWADNEVDVYGSQSELEELVEDLNDAYDLKLTNKDIQETGSECLLRFQVCEDF